MNLSPIVTVSSAPPPAEVSRSSEPAHTEEFSGVLSQQQGPTNERRAATTHAASNAAQVATADPDAPTPNETLALLAAGATLPLMMARAELTDEAGGMARGTRASGDTVLTVTTSASRASTDDAAKPTAAQAQVLLSTAMIQRDKAADTLPATDRLALPALARTTESIAPTPADARNAQTASTRPHTTALTSRTSAAQIAAHASTKPDAAQSAFAQIVSAIKLDTQPIITSAIDNRSIQDAANAMAGAAQAHSPSTTLLTTQTSAPIVATPLSNPAWATDFSRQFISITQGRDMSAPHTIELRLDPPSLGPVRITMHISDSIAQAAFVSPHAVVRQAIENALPQLQQQLAEAGLSLGQTSVNDQPGGQQGFEQSSPQGAQHTAVFSLDGSSTASNTETWPSAPRHAPRSPDALVDTFA